MAEFDFGELAGAMDAWAGELGFSAWGVAGVDGLGAHRERLDAWLAKGFHGSMGYMARHRDLRGEPLRLDPGAASVISLRLDYLPPGAPPSACLAEPGLAYVSRYALGRDYHKVVRGKLKRLAQRLSAWLAARGHEGLRARPFADSAPLLEKALAEQAGLGWIGKNTLLLNEGAGSWFFLGELLTNLPLPPSERRAESRCGSCAACIEVCPTGALVAPYQLDARLCISYLTIEQKGSIAPELRPLMGNRVFGCDDCQLVCPWNRYAAVSGEGDFQPRHGLDTAGLLGLFAWTREEFLARTEGSAIRRAGYHGWLRNLAVALGNAVAAGEAAGPIRRALKARLGLSPLVDEHIHWALAQTSPEQQAAARP